MPKKSFRRCCPPFTYNGQGLTENESGTDANKPEEIIPGLFKGNKIAIGGAVKASKSIMVGNFIMAAVNNFRQKNPWKKVLIIDLEVDFWELSRLFGLAQKDSNGAAQYSEDLFILSLRKRPDCSTGISSYNSSRS